MELNPQLIENIIDIYGEKGRTWLKNLPQRITQLADLWQFQFIKPMPELSYNFVGLVRLENDKTSILKIAPEGAALASEINWLKAVEEGVPDVYQCSERLDAYLMEHLEPGSSLKELVLLGNDETATRIICQMINNFQSHSHPIDNFPHLSKCFNDLNILDNKFNPKLLSKAKSLFRDLNDERDNDVLLHGDLHHDNILSCQETWKAIDPHGYIGSPIAEVGTLIRNPIDCFPNGQPVQKVIENRLAIMSEELPFDPQRMRDWAFCVTVLSAAWSFEGHGKVLDIEIEVAEALDQIKL